MVAQDFFVWGNGGAKLTPDEIATRRAMEEKKLEGGIDASPVGDWTQGAARVVDALSGVVRRNRLDTAAKENQDYNAKMLSSLFGDGQTGAGLQDGASSPVAPPSIFPASAAGASAMKPGDTFEPFISTVKAGGVTNPNALAAIAATGKAESGFSAGNANRSWNDGANNAGGIMSWNGPRLQNMYNFAASKGEKPGAISPQTQAQFFLQENPELVGKLNSAKSLDEAQSLMNNAWKFKGYDQPGGEAARRLALAQSYAPMFQGDGAQVASTDPSAGMSMQPLPAQPPAVAAINAQAQAAPADAANWIKYDNSGATRSQPLNPNLVKSLGFLPEMGITMDVFSGGQPGIEEGGPRTGSIRHDHGNAADVFFMKDGRRLDWANPNDQPIFQDIVKRAKANGVTGFGAGDGYMQPGSMHIGFGTPAVWGAGGRGSNAPDWLRSAFEGAPAQAPAANAINAQMQPGQAAPPMVPPVNIPARPEPAQTQPDPVKLAQAVRQRGPTQQQLLQALADPMANDATKRVAQALLQQQMEQEKLNQQMQAQQALKQMEWSREDNRNGVLDQRWQTENDLAKQKFAFDQTNASRTGDIKDYEYAKSQGFNGSFTDYQSQMKKAGAASTNVNLGEGNKFYDELDKKNAENIAAMSESGLSARSRLSQLNQLDTLLQNSPTGFEAGVKLWAGDMGIPTEGLDGLQATRALVEKMVPEQRTPGSGTMSDSDIKMYRNSLPSVLNQPGGNALIIGTAKSIAEYDMKIGEIADKIADRTLTPKEGRELMKSMPNPLEGYSEKVKSFGKPSTQADGQQKVLQPMSSGPVPIKSVDDYNNLPSGTTYVDPQGKVRVKK